MVRAVAWVSNSNSPHRDERASGRLGKRQDSTGGGWGLQGAQALTLVYSCGTATAHPSSMLTGSLKPYSRNNPGTNVTPRIPLIHPLLHFLVTLFSPVGKANAFTDIFSDEQKG